MQKLLAGCFFIWALLGIMTGQAASFKTSDVVIDYEISGDGEPLVMLHSGMMSRDDMRTQIDYFSNFYKVIAIDAREQGRSTASSQQISYDLMASDVIALLDELKIDSANIFGQSDGAITALTIAIRHPGRLDQMIIHGAVFNKNAYPNSQREGWMNVTWDKEQEGATDPAGFPGMAISSYLLGRSSLDAFESHYQEMARMWATSPNFTLEDLDNVPVPTLVIVGDHWDISLTHTVEMHEALPNSQLFIAPNATHFIHQEKPDLVHKIIHDFLSEE